MPRFAMDRNRSLRSYLMAGALISLLLPVQGNIQQRYKRVIGGQPVPTPNPCTVPYIVIVEKTCQTSAGAPIAVNFRCAGTIIDKEDVVTARQCVTRGTPLGCDVVTQVRVTAGAHFFGNLNEPGRQVALARQVAEHPDPAIDLAVINLNLNLTLAPRWLEAASLPTAQLGVGVTVRAAGWGRTLAGNPQSNPADLQNIDLVVRAVTPERITLSDTGNPETTGVYEGDSGGPIISYLNSINCTEPRLVGVINCPTGSCGQGRALHVNIFNVVNWIRWNQENDDGSKLTATTAIIMTTLLLSYILRF